jgi:hypothetical protein
MALEITENKMAEPILPEMQDISRQRDLAKLLLQKGMSDNLQGQMVSGRYVGASPWQGIANIYSAYKGRELATEADKKQIELAKMLREQGVVEAQDILSTMRGRQGRPEVVPQGQTLLDDQGMLTMGSQRGVASVAPDLESAYAKSVGARTTQGQAFAPLLAKQLMPDQTPEEKRYKAAVADGSWKPEKMGGFNAFLNQLTEKDKFMIRKDTAELADKGIFLGGGVSSGGGMPSSGMPMVGGQGGAKVTGDAKFMPANLPVYEIDPNLTNAQNREEAGKFSSELRKNVKNAKNTFDLLKDASGILNTGSPSSGMLESMATGTKRFFGQGGETSKSDQRLNMIAGALTMTQPRFEGPQGVLDVKLYEKQAGDLGNPNLPIADRLAAVQQMINLQKKYYPNGDWESIDVSGPVMTKQTFLRGEKRFDPVTYRQGLSPQDQAAFDWSRANPNDPRSNEIKQKLGIQ